MLNQQNLLAQKPSQRKIDYQIVIIVRIFRLCNFTNFHILIVPDVPNNKLSEDEELMALQAEMGMN